MKKLILHLLLSCTLLSSAVLAQDVWPSKPIKFIVPYSAGGGADLIARVIGNQLSKDLQQPVVVDNRPGASGMIGGSACKSASPDGYTFCVFLSDVVACNPALFKNVPYNAETDFVPVAFMADNNNVVVTSTRSGIKDMKGLIDLRKQNPAGTNWGSWGVGSSGHLLLSIIDKATNTEITHVPYVSTPALIAATLNNEVQATVSGYGLVQGHVEQRAMRVVAVMGDKRLPFLPDVPTLQEQGIPLTATLWYGMFAPTGTPPKVVTEMNAAVNRSIAKAVATKALDLKIVGTRADSQPEFAEFVARESATWRDVVRRSGIRLD